MLDLRRSIVGLKQETKLDTAKPPWSRFGRPQTASRLREWMSWSVALTQEFVVIWILLVPGFSRIPGRLLRSTSLWVSGFLDRPAGDDTSPFEVLPLVRPAGGSAPIARSARTSVRPLRVRHRWHGNDRRRGRACPRDRICYTGRRADNLASSWLWCATPSATSQPLVEVTSGIARALLAGQLQG